MNAVQSRNIVDMTPNLVNRLLIVGASARAAAWSARRAGFDVVAADLFADTDLQQLAKTIQVEPREYPQALGDLVHRRKIRAIYCEKIWPQRTRS